MKDPNSGELIGVEFYLFLNVFREEVARGYDYKAVLTALRDQGHLTPSNGRPFDFRARLPGVGKVNCYRIRSTLLADGASDLV